MENNMLASRYLIFSLILLIVLIVACGQPPVITDENYQQHANMVVAKSSGEYSLTAADLFKAIQATDILPNGGTVPEDRVIAFLDSLVADTLIGLQADEDITLEDYYQDFWTYRLRNQNYLIEAYIEHHVLADADLDTAAVVKFVSDHPDHFQAKEQVLIYHILAAPRWFTSGPDSARYRGLSPEELDEVTHRYADSLWEMLNEGQDFEAVAYKYSHDKATKEYGGLVGWAGRGYYLPPFDSVAFSLKPGEYSRPYHDKDGWHIVYVTDYVPEGLMSMDRPEFYQQARQSMIGSLIARETNRVLDSLRQDLSLEYNEPALDSNVFKGADSTWVAVVNGVDTIDYKIMRNMELDYRDRYQITNTTAAIKKQMITQLADRFLLLQAVRADGIDTLPDARTTEHALRHEAVKAIAMRERFDPTWRASDSAIELYYQEHYRDFVPEKPLTIQEIVVPDSLLAEFVYDQAMAGVDFIELAREYYPGDTAYHVELADVGKVGPDDIDASIYEEALTIPNESVTRPTRLLDGKYHIVKVVNRDESTTLLQSRGRIFSILTEQHNQEDLRNSTDGLLNRFGVTFPNSVPPMHLKPLRYRPGHEK